jgi:hypothetical protein
VQLWWQVVEQKGDAPVDRLRADQAIVVEHQHKTLRDCTELVEQSAQQRLDWQRLKRMQQRERACADVGLHRLQRSDEVGPEQRGVIVALIDLDQLRTLLAEGSVTLLDVRPALEYRQGHIPGAWSVPVDELERRLAELPRDREVVAYAVGRTASIPTRPPNCCSGTGSACAGWRRDFPSGARPDCPSKLVSARTAPRPTTAIKAPHRQLSTRGDT